jgi:hypothetical protein
MGAHACCLPRHLHVEALQNLQSRRHEDPRLTFLEKNRGYTGLVEHPHHGHRDLIPRQYVEDLPPAGPRLLQVPAYCRDVVLVMGQVVAQVLEPLDAAEFLGPVRRESQVRGAHAFHHHLVRC